MSLIKLKVHTPLIVPRMEFSYKEKIPAKQITKM